MKAINIGALSWARSKQFMLMLFNIHFISWILGFHQPTLQSAAHTRSESLAGKWQHVHINWNINYYSTKLIIILIIIEFTHVFMYLHSLMIHKNLLTCVMFDAQTSDVNQYEELQNIYNAIQSHLWAISWTKRTINALLISVRASNF